LSSHEDWILRYTRTYFYLCVRTAVFSFLNSYFNSNTVDKIVCNITCFETMYVSNNFQ